MIHLVVACDRSPWCSQTWETDPQLGAQATLEQAARNGWRINQHSHFCPIHASEGTSSRTWRRGW